MHIQLSAWLLGSREDGEDRGRGREEQADCPTGGWGPGAAARPRLGLRDPPDRVVVPGIRVLGSRPPGERPRASRRLQDTHTARSPFLPPGHVLQAQKVTPSTPPPSHVGTL